MLRHKASREGERNEIEWVPIRAGDIKITKLPKHRQDCKQSPGGEHGYYLEIAIQAKEEEGNKKTENKTGKEIINCLPSLENRINSIGSRSPGEGDQALIAFVVKKSESEAKMLSISQVSPLAFSILRS